MDIKEAIKERHSVRQYSSDHIKAGFGPFTKLDLGIVRYNFEVASGHKCRAI